ncbi:uncharacterized protein LOC142357235 [Convolutriloba macropyga]|uniref:uncharacterized protein LOC142357235 n=1 Tax=Convolutriloba macropyga TaxID=536237 RepID=UPI003F51DA5F
MSAATASAPQMPAPTVPASRMYPPPSRGDATEVSAAEQQLAAKKPGFGLPFLRIVTGNMKKFVRIKKKWEVNDRFTAIGGADWDIDSRSFKPRVDLAYKLNDRFGSVILTDRKVGLRKDFRVHVSKVSMRVRCELGCNLRGKPLFPRLDIDDPKPIKFFLAAAAVWVALQNPMSISKAMPSLSTPVPLTKKRAKVRADLGWTIEAHVKQRALCFSINNLGGVFSA